MSQINFKPGDATNVTGENPTIIVHVCNDLGGWGRGFVLSLSKRWPAPEREYRKWYQGRNETKDFALGRVQFVPAEGQIWVANIIAQHGYASPGAPPPIRYDALRSGLQQVATFALQQKASIQMPRIGAGLAGGDWQIIQKIIEEELAEKGLEVTVYDFGAPQSSQLELERL